MAPKKGILQSRTPDIGQQPGKNSTLRENPVYNSSFNSFPQTLYLDSHFLHTKLAFLLIHLSTWQQQQHFLRPRNFDLASGISILEKRLCSCFREFDFDPIQLLIAPTPSKINFNLFLSWQQQHAATGNSKNNEGL